MNKIKCNIIDYRKGYIEIKPNIHDGCINLETWQIHPDINILELDIEDDSLPDEGVFANTEIEMSVKIAENLIDQLTKAVNIVKKNK